MTEEGGALIAAAAALSPLGLRQRGHSGVFIADHGYWLAIAQFDRERARLAVGAHWLWFVQPRWCFDWGEQLDWTADRPYEMARQAAEAVGAVEARFDTVAAIAVQLAAPADARWPLYHAGVAAGLAGDAGAASAFLARLAAKETRSDWERELQATARALVATLPDRAAFRAAVAEIVARTRSLQGLKSQPVSFEQAGDRPVGSIG